MAEKAVVKAAARHAAVKTPTNPKVVNRQLPASEKKLPTRAKHSAGYTRGQVAADTKGIVTFGASKTRSGFMKSFDNSAAPRLKPKKSVVTYRHVLAAEFWVGLFVLLFEDTTNENTSNTSRWVQLAAFIFCWAILFGITAGGTDAARFAAALGGLILLTIMVKKGNPFNVLAIFADKTSTSGVGAGIGNEFNTEPGTGVGRQFNDLTSGNLGDLNAGA